MDNPGLAIFSFFTFFIGCTITPLAYDAQDKLPPKCINSNVQNGLTFIIMLGVFMIVVPLMQIFCYWKCSIPQNHLRYRVIMMIICVLLIIGCSVVINGINNNKSTCEAPNPKNFTIAILSISVIALIGIILTYSNKFNQLISGNDNTTASHSI